MKKDDEKDKTLTFQEHMVAAGFGWIISSFT